MSDLVERLFGTVKESLRSAPGEIGTELKHQVSAGAHELAAALFTGGAFIMYPRNSGKDDPAQTEGIDVPDHGLGAVGMEQARGRSL